MNHTIRQFALLRIAALLGAAAAPVAGLAQEDPVFVQTICWSVEPGKTSEFRDLMTTDGRKLAQASRDLGELVSWMSSQTVTPYGEQAECHFISVYAYRGTPKSPMFHTDEAYAKAGLQADAVLARIRSMARLVQTQTRFWQRMDGAGELREGDFYRLNAVRVNDFPQWWETVKIHMAVQRERINNGKIKFAAHYVLVLPLGERVPYTAASVVALNDFQSYGVQDDEYATAFQKAHPGLNIEWFGEKLRQASTLVESTLHSVVAQVRSE